MKFIIILLFLLSLISSIAQDQDVSFQVVKEGSSGFITDSETSKCISFTLENSSFESIPLIIPNVMNPNLSPNSKSGVTLKIGQEILFRYKLKKHVLLTVSDSIQNGAVLDVPVILKKRISELKTQSIKHEKPQKQCLTGLKAATF